MDGGVMRWVELTPRGRRRVAGLLDVSGRVLLAAGAVSLVAALALASYYGWNIGTGSSGVPEWTELLLVPLSIAALAAVIGLLPAAALVLGTDLRSRAAELRANSRAR